MHTYIDSLYLLVLPNPLSWQTTLSSDAFSFSGRSMMPVLPPVIDSFVVMIAMSLIKLTSL